MHFGPSFRPIYLKSILLEWMNEGLGDKIYRNQRIERKKAYNKLVIRQLLLTANCSFFLRVSS